MMPRFGMLPRKSGSALAVLGIVGALGLSMASQRARAADLDEMYEQPEARQPSPTVVAGVGRRLDPRCRIVPMPEPNLYLDTTRFRPTMVCMSRGMLADSFGPYPFSYPYYSRY